MEEGEDFVICQICRKRLKAITNSHLKKHRLSADEYRSMFPDSLLTSQITCRKHIEPFSGDKNPMKREEVRQKTSNSLKKYYESPEAKELARELYEKKKDKMIKAAHTEAANKKRGESLIGHVVTEATRKKIGVSKIGDKNPAKRPEVRKKNSEWHKKYSTGGKGKERPSMKGNLNPINQKEFREKHLQAMRSNKNVERARKAQMKNWENKEYVEKLMKSLRRRPNEAEKRLRQLLNSILPHEYVYNGDFSAGISINRKIPDFVNVNGQKKVIELYGDFWHKDDNPQDRIDLFKKYGYDCLVIWGSEMEDEKKVVNRVLEFHKLPSQRCRIQSTLGD